MTIPPLVLAGVPRTTALFNFSCDVTLMFDAFVAKERKAAEAVAFPGGLRLGRWLCG